jgi:nicotinamide mononucleotide transporter
LPASIDWHVFWTGIDWVEAVGAVLGALCVGLQVKQIIWNWPLGIANNILYIVVFFRSGLFADCGLQVVYIIISIYGWWAWLRAGEQHSHLKISRITLRHGLMVAAATAASVLCIHWLLKTYTPSNVPWGDATTVSLSLAAQYLISRKVLENWYVWNMANVLCIALFVYKHLYPTASLYAIFFGMCVMGYVDWRKELRADEAAQAAAV